MFRRKKLKTAQSQDLAKKISDRAIEFQSSSTKHVSKYLTKRQKRIQGTERFVIGWVALAVLLCAASSFAAWNLHAKSKIASPADGGTYVEGMVGNMNNINPLFATGAADSAASQLVFNSLLEYDTEEVLRPELAKSWQVGKDEKSYTVTLKEGVTWHDGEPFTARDVLFTIRTIQDPATRSPLLSSWQGVAVKQMNETQVQFSLRAPSAPFADVLASTSILPAHILEDTPADSLRTAEFNSAPVGTGPFIVQLLRQGGEEQRLELSANPDYFLGKPRVERFVLAVFEDEGALIKQLESREITAAADLSAAALKEVSTSARVRTAEYPLNRGVFAFMKTSKAPFDDLKVRQALVAGTDRMPLLDLFNTRYQPMQNALIPDEVGHSHKYDQKTNLKRAAQLLDSAGWKLKDGVRQKKGQPLEFKITTAETPEYSQMAAELQRQWEPLGLKITPEFLNQEQLEQNALSAHEYDILLYGISLGSDPDVYAYWHSSQARPGGLNFSEWKSDRADLSLEIGRTRLNPVLREARYNEFLDEWLKQAPAVALYRPRMNYSYHQDANGMQPFSLNSTAQRFSTVHEWTVNTRRVHLTP